MYNVWRTTVILIVTMYTEFVLYYTMLIVLNKFNSISNTSMVHSNTWRHLSEMVYPTGGDRGKTHLFRFEKDCGYSICRWKQFPKICGIYVHVYYVL